MSQDRSVQLPDSLGISLLAALTAWFALLSWQGFIDDSRHFTLPLLFGAVLVAGTGAIARSARVSVWVTPLLQLVVVGLWLNLKYSSAASWLGLPTSASVTDLVHRIGRGIDVAQTYASPVNSRHSDMFAMLVAAGLAIMIVTDLLACGFKQAPLAGLPLLLTMMIVISVLEPRVPWVVFAATAISFTMLLTAQEADRTSRWGRHEGGRWEDSLTGAGPGPALRVNALRIGGLATAGALVVPLLLPVGQGVIGNGSGNGSGGGVDDDVHITNPMVDLQRDLTRGKDKPMVRVRTAEPDPSYLRLAVLDEFDGSQWKPSRRDIPSRNRASGTLPQPPGLASYVQGEAFDWSVRTLPGLRSTWLPTPYPLRSLSVDGDWRYDSRTYDFVNAGDEPTRDLTYSLVAFRPEYDAGQLASAVPAPIDLSNTMTRLPEAMPRVIEETADRVTDRATDDFERAVALQDWFRDGGGFRYSTAHRPGSGLAQLARFITDDKVGYCEQFAAAMAVMARSLGIPARVAVGFLRPESLGANRYEFSSHDLHAWPELYFSGAGWIRFEPTPGSRTGGVPDYTTGQVSTDRTTAPAPTAAPSGAATPGPAPLAGTAAGGTDRGDTLPWWVPAAVVLLALVLALIPRLVRDNRRRRRWADALDPSSVADAAWLELRDTAVDLGLTWRDDLSVRSMAAHLVEQIEPGAELVRRIGELVEFVERARYARAFDPPAEAATRMREHVEASAAVMRAAVRTGAVWRARWLPRSAFERVASPTTPTQSDQLV